MELPILILQDTLNQQREQLSQAEKDLNKQPKFKEFRQKGINNLKCFIAELEEGINILTLANKQKEAFSIQRVSGSCPIEAIMHYDKLIKTKLERTFEPLRDHGTHAEFCDKINDLREEAKSNYR